MTNNTRTVAASAAVAATFLVVGSHEDAQAQSGDDFGATPPGMSFGDTGIGTPITPGLSPPIDIGTPTTLGIGASRFPLGSGLGGSLRLGLTSGAPGVDVRPGIGTSLPPSIGTSVLPGIGTSLQPGIGTGLPPRIGTSLPPGIGTSVTPGIGTPTAPGIGTVPGQASGSPPTIDPLPTIGTGAPGAGATFGGGGFDPDSLCEPEDFTCLD